MANPLFKAYPQNQSFLFPPSLDSMIADTHPVRVVNEVIDELDIDIILKKYKGGGTTSYHPRMLLKVLVYGYLNNVYSSRKIAASVKENIYFMWLAGMQQPDHRTINLFRSERLRNILKEIFAQIVLLLVDSGHVSLKEIYTDGSKIESVANRYSFVWGKAIQTNREKIKRQLKELWSYTQNVAAKEKSDDEPPPDFEKIDSKEVKQTIDRINTTLKDIEKVDPKIKQKLKYAQKHWPARLKQYKKQEKILAGRNSYSKTDTGATFMRMKEDHMKNGQLKPGYNAQISTNNQFVVNYTIHPNPTDTKTLIPHLEQYKKLYNALPEVQVADAGYGSEENYQYLDNQSIQAYVKPTDFDRKQKRTYQPNPFATEQLEYDAAKDQYSCPIGNPMKYVGQKIRKRNGVVKTYSLYKASGCKNCPLREACHRQKGNRLISVNHKGNLLRQQASERLKTGKGIYYRKKRPADVEPVFANIKHNKNFKRFLLKGIDKTEIEWGLLCIAHNLKKIAA
jgi:transposase